MVIIMNLRERWIRFMIRRVEKWMSDCLVRYIKYTLFKRKLEEQLKWSDIADETNLKTSQHLCQKQSKASLAQSKRQSKRKQVKKLKSKECL